MKNRIISGLVLFIIFIAALIGFSVVLNQGTDDMTEDMGSAKLPVISFEESGYQVNPLVGYTEEMDISVMRDNILPVSVGTFVTADISGYAGTIRSLKYEVMTLDGEKVLKSGTIKKVSDAVKLELGDSISDGQEKALRLTLTTENEEKIYYYTRIVRAAEFNVQQCLEFAEYFHTTAMESDTLTDLKKYYSSEGASEGNGLQKVTLASDLNLIGWGDLTPKVEGEMIWEIKESNQTYTSISLKYQVKAGEGLYNITEFFKVRFLRGRASLESYVRTMNEVFEGKEKNFSKDGILLGLTSADVPYLTDKKGEHISFVQERELWHYDKKENQISLLFSFADAENQDIRNKNDDHSIRLLDMDEKGNTVFAVYGYMNRGEHEGQTGAAIYYYDIAEQYVQEKAFIASRQSGEIVQQSLSYLTYYNRTSNVLYAMFEGTLYKVNLKNQKKEVIQDGLSEGQYASSPNGKYIAYQKDGDFRHANAIEIWDLQKEKSVTIEVPEEEVIRPLGFIKGDIVYGIGREGDIGKNTIGEDVEPLYKLEIRDQKNKVEKSYEVEGIYIADALVEENMITMERVIKSGNVYQETTQDFITNNESKKETGIKVERVSSSATGFQIRLTDESGIEERNPKLIKPKQMLFERATTIGFDKDESKGAYYVYGLGKLQGIYEKAGDAIYAADVVRGVVVTANQTKVWERGNRMLSYQIEGLDTFTTKVNESPLAACLNQILVYEKKTADAAAELAAGKTVMDVLNQHSGGEAIDLSGCTLEQLCYVIGKGTPVLALTRDGGAILLVGYDENTFTYMNPATGKKPTEKVQDMEALTGGMNGTFFGYVK